MFVGLTVSNLDAIAYHLEQGVDNGGVSKEALARFLRSVARDLESTEQGHEADVLSSAEIDQAYQDEYALEQSNKH